MENIIEIDNLSFSFNNKKQVLKDISLQVPKGSIYGFLGANGTGKSTTMRLIMGLYYNDDKDAIKVFNQPISEIYPEAFQKIGSLIDYPAFYSHLSGYDNLKVVCIIRNLDSSKIDKVLETVGLTEAKHIKMKRYSLGMKQRLAIALALISDPELLILDEPVNGLDPQGMIEVRQLLTKLNVEHGTTIFISSHLLQEVDKMVTHLAILSDGKVKFQGAKKELEQLYGFKKTKFALTNASQYAHLFPENQNYQMTGDNEIVFNTSDEKEIAELNRMLVENGANVYHISSDRNFEDWFMEITK